MVLASRMPISLQSGETAVATYGDVVLTQTRVIGPSGSGPGYAAIAIGDVAGCRVITRRAPTWLVVVGALVLVAGLVGVLKFNSEAAGWSGLVVGALILLWHRTQGVDVLVVQSASETIEQKLSSAEAGSGYLVSQIEFARARPAQECQPTDFAVPPGN
jgi:hypothetical protein